MARSEHKRRIGVLGGTFDPVHLGHLVLAETARKNLKLDKVIFIPTRIPPHKQRPDIIDAEQRYRMVELAVSENKYFCVSRIEIDKKGISYSVETLQELKKQNPDGEFFFLAGSDALPELNTWKQIDEIFGLCNFVIAKRPGFEKYALPKETIFLEGNFLEISSSQIREAVHQDKPVENLLPAQVYQFIIKNHLYR